MAQKVPFPIVSGPMQMREGGAIAARIDDGALGTPGCAQMYSHTDGHSRRRDLHGDQRRPALAGTKDDPDWDRLCHLDRYRYSLHVPHRCADPTSVMRFAGVALIIAGVVTLKLAH